MARINTVRPRGGARRCRSPGATSRSASAPPRARRSRSRSPAPRSRSATSSRSRATSSSRDGRSPAPTSRSSSVRARPASTTARSTRSPSGVLLTNATSAWSRAPTAGTYALFATGTLQIIGVAGITVVGTATVRFNDTGSSRRPDPRHRRQPTATSSSASSTTTNVASFSARSGWRSRSSARPCVATSRSPSRARHDPRHGRPDVSRRARRRRQFTNGVGTLLITPTGIAADVGVDVAVNLPGVSPVPTTIRANTTGAAIDRTFDSTAGQRRHDPLPAGPYFKVTADDVDLTIAGQTLTATSRSSRSRRPMAPRSPASPPPTSARRSARDDASRHADGGRGQLHPHPDRHRRPARRSLSPVVRRQPRRPDLRSPSTRTGAAVNETFRVAGVDIAPRAARPASTCGSRPRFDLSIAGQSLRGDFSFEQLHLAASSTARDGRPGRARQRVAVARRRAAAACATGSGTCWPPTAGIAGRFSASTSRVAIPNVAVVRRAGGRDQPDQRRRQRDVHRRRRQTQTLVLEAGPFVPLRVAGRGIQPVVFGQTLCGDFVFRAPADVVDDRGDQRAALARRRPRRVTCHRSPTRHGTVRHRGPPGSPARSRRESVDRQRPERLDRRATITSRSTPPVQALSATIGTALDAAAGQYVRVDGTGAISVFGQIAQRLVLDRAAPRSPAGIGGQGRYLGRRLWSSVAVVVPNDGIVRLSGFGGFLITPAGVAGELRRRPRRRRSPGLTAPPRARRAPDQHVDGGGPRDVRRRAAGRGVDARSSSTSRPVRSSG